MMRTTLVISYFVLLIVIFFGIGALSAQEVFERNGDTYHQRVFGFQMEIPENWQISDEGTISVNGDYLISFGPDLDSGARIYISFFPVRGLTLQEFANESMIELILTDDIAYEEVQIGNLDCLVCRQSMSSREGQMFPDLTSVFSRIGDHFFRAFFYSYDKSQREEVLDILRTISFDRKMIELSFLAVKNFQNYGIQTSVNPKNEMYILEHDPEMPTGMEPSDGTESIIMDDFEYPTRFPAGEQEDEYGYRVQYCINGRYQVDNREKTVDVYIPDMQVDARNFVFEVDMRFEGGHPAKGNGVIFRGGESGFYLFDLSPEGYYSLYNYTAGFNNVVEKTYTGYASALDVNNLRLECRENRLKIYLNEKRLKTVYLGDEHETGYVGLYVSAGSWASFDNYFFEIEP